MLDRLLKDFVKENGPRLCPSPIVAKSELLQVMVDSPFPNEGLMSPQHPALQQGGDSMDVWKDMFSLKTIGLVLNNVLKAQGFDPAVALPSVRDDRRPRLEVVSQKGYDASFRGIGDLCQAHAPSSIERFLQGDNHQHFPVRSSATLPRLFSANESFVDFHDPVQLLSPGNNHQSPELVEPTPRSLVASKAQNPLQAECAYPRLLSHSPPDCPKPSNQGLPCPVENGSSNNGDLFLT